MSYRRRAASRSVVAAAVASLAMSLAPLASPTPVRAVPSGPVAEWKFNESSGTTAADAIGNNDGTLIGNPTWAPSAGHEGGALQFDGDGDGVQVPTATALEPNSVSVSFWMKGSLASSGQWSTIVQKGANECEAGSYGIQASGIYDANNPGAVQARVETSTIGNYAGSSSPQARLWDSQWHLVAWTFDAVANVGKLYIDGISSDTQVTPLLYDLPTASDLFIGHEPVDCGDSRDFQGVLDDLRIYNRALTASEISSQVAPITTSTTLSIETNPLTYGQWSWAPVTVTPAPVESAEVRIYDVTGGGHVLVGGGSTSPTTGIANVQLISGPFNPFDVGSYDLVAEAQAIGPYSGSTSGEVPFVVDKNSPAVTLSAPSSVTPGSAVQLVGTISPYTDGTATFYEDLGDAGLQSLGTAPLVPISGGYQVAIETPPLSLGDHTFVLKTSETAHWTGESSDPETVHVAEVASATSIGVAGDLQAHHPITLYASVGPASPIPSPPPATGTITFRDGTAVVGAVDLAVTNQLVIPLPTAGGHSYTAEYSGDEFYLGSTSDPAAVAIAADTVDATGVTVQYALFYPYKDGYRDTDAIKGNRLEPLSVSIRVYNANNGLVKSVSLARASGAYSYAWNGRNSSGAILAAGKYRIVQTLTDAFGTKKAFTSYATISTKRLVSHSTYITRYGYPPTASGQGGTGAGYYSSTGKYLKLVAGADGYVVAGWQFTLPSATVYKALKFQAYVKGVRSTNNLVAAQNFKTCPLSSSWFIECFDHAAVIGGSGTAWYSTTISPTYNRSGRTARGMVIVQSSTIYVYKVRMYVSYQTLQ